MTLDEFVIKNRVNLSPNTVSACFQGIEIMRQSVIPLYDERHIFSILSILDKLLENEKMEGVDFEVLLLAICWHDVWKSYRFPLSLLALFRNQIWEGLGSMSIFGNVAKVFNLDKGKAKAVQYVIRKHSGLQFLKTKTLEAKILQDIDGLEEWSLKRVEPLKSDYFFLLTMNPGIEKMAKYYLSHFMVNDSDAKFHFPWSKEEFKRRKRLFLNEAFRVIEDYGLVFKQKKK